MSSLCFFLLRSGGENKLPAVVCSGRRFLFGKEIFMQVFDVLLDTKTTGCQQTVSMYQGENSLKYLRITLLHNGNIYYVPSGFAAVLRGEKPDGTSLTHKCRIRCGQIFYQPTVQTTAATGIVRCQIFLYGASGALLTTPEFELDVAESLGGVELTESADEIIALDMPALLALSLSDDGRSLCVNGEPINIFVDPVDTLPQSAETGDFVYLSGEGLYLYADGWQKLTDDSLGSALTAVSDDVSAIQSALPTAQDKTAWNEAAANAHTHNNKAVLDDTTVDKTARWDTAYSDAHTHSNKSVLDDLSVQNGVLLLDGASVGIDVVDTLPAQVTVGKLIFQRTAGGGYFHIGKQRGNGEKYWLAVLDHSHLNKTAIDKITEQSGKMLFDGKTVVTETPDDVTLLSFTEYDGLSLRDDFTGIGSLDDVPIYVLDGDGFGIGLYEDMNDTENCDSIVLTDMQDDGDGNPVRLIRVKKDGVAYARWSHVCMILGNTFQPGVWYTNNAQTTAPDLSGFHPTGFNVCDSDYEDLRNLPEKAASALRSLSQLVNVSAAAMGTINVPENAEQRLTSEPKVGMRYAYQVNWDMVMQLPLIEWTGKKQEFWVDLTCDASINLSFSDTVRYANGNNIDTTLGKHRLHFYVLAGDDMWTVEEIESETDVSEDVVPDYVIPFAYISADQLKAVLKYGYHDGNGAWCVRKNGIVLEFFHIGDTRLVTLTNGDTVHMRIIDVEHDDLTLGGKANLTCDFKELIPVETYSPTTGGYGTSSMRTSAQSVLNLMPDWIQELVPNVVKQYNEQGYTVIDKVWPFASGEVGYPVQSGKENIGTVYPVFTDNASRVRKNLSGNDEGWLLRSYQSYGGKYDWIQASGTGIAAYSISSPNNIAVGFCLHVD